MVFGRIGSSPEHPDKNSNTKATAFAAAVRSARYWPDNCLVQNIMRASPIGKSDKANHPDIIVAVTRAYNNADIVVDAIDATHLTRRMLARELADIINRQLAIRGQFVGKQFIGNDVIHRLPGQAGDD